jgi:hypothetical protein
MASERRCVCGEADVGGNTHSRMKALRCQRAVHIGWLP